MFQVLTLLKGDGNDEEQLHILPLYLTKNNDGIEILEK
jgi:hypothetical protein